jgi:hypothetical protein
LREKSKGIAWIFLAQAVEQPVETPRIPGFV